MGKVADDAPDLSTPEYQANFASAEFDACMAVFKKGWAEAYPSEPFEVAGVITPKAMDYIRGYAAGIDAVQVTKEGRPARISVQLDADQIELIDLWRRRWPVKEEQFSRSGAVRHAVNVFLRSVIASIELEDGISLPLDQKVRIQAQLESATRTKWEI